MLRWSLPPSCLSPLLCLPRSHLGLPGHHPHTRLYYIPLRGQQQAKQPEQQRHDDGSSNNDHRRIAKRHYDQTQHQQLQRLLHTKQCVVHNDDDSGRSIRCVLFRSRKQGGNGIHTTLMKGASVRYYSNASMMVVVRALPNSMEDALCHHYSRDVNNQRQIQQELDPQQQNSLSALSSSSLGSTPFSLERARQQHDYYVAMLEDIVRNSNNNDKNKRSNPSQVVVLPPLHEFPDSTFVEDAALALGPPGHVLLTHPGHVTRSGEVTALERELMMDQDDSSNRRNYWNITRLWDLDSTAICDGGDVLITRRHVFVGLSQRTNEAAGRAIAHYVEHELPPPPPLSTCTFQPTTGTAMPTQQHRRQEVVMVPPVVQGHTVLHLKSAVTCLDDETLLVPMGELGDRLLLAMQATKRGYQHIVRLNTTLGCNVVRLHDSVLIQNVGNTVAVLEPEARIRNLRLIVVPFDQMAKKDAALTCCSLLLPVPVA